ncbi:bifunctional shikimate kinase/3-dehydroquinate synthase [Microbacterium sp. KR10-403]|uniref:bifunctional shikimate kinase/3-dehydroquinate synthase n=1 Tax=Microbacterium sp. KR10-403 TaxID=3158581 RepID=UPI0032E44B7F
MVVLIGFMGAGKSTVGRIVADLLGVPFVDSDVLIERREGRSIREMFDLHGEPYFRQIERTVVAELLEDRTAVVALGGGAALDPEIGRMLASHTVVYLEVPYDQAMERINGDAFRPLLQTSGVRQVYERRLPVYESLATIRIDTGGRRADDIAVEVVRAMVPPPVLPEVSSLLVSTVGGTYFAHSGPRLIPETARLIPGIGDAEHIVLVTARVDETIAETVAEQLGRDRVLMLPVDDGEAGKTFEVIADIAQRMAERAVHRSDIVVGIGGEAVCEIAGLVASLFNRGMPLALVPTTLVAQADSALGGKNAISLPQGRNLIGTIHQPVAVVADTDVAARADQRGYSAGLAEIAKHALLDGAAAVERVMALAPRLREREQQAVAEAVAASQEFKAAIVGRDERETGERTYLNYGHTFGHAIEWLLGLDASVEGTPIAVGMMAAAHLARVQGRLTDADVDTHRRLLHALGLPIAARIDVDRLQSAWTRDKKYDHGVRLVLLDGIGAPARGCTATREELAAALDALAAH